jgi:hypothetical protein
MAEMMDLEGKNILVRTVTNFYTGHVVKETKKYLLLDKAAWIADTGRFADALASSVFGEVEPYARPVYVMKAAFVDVTEIGDLPNKQK